MVAMHSRTQVPSFCICASLCARLVQDVLPLLLTLPNEIIPGMTVKEISPPPYEHSSDEPLRKWDLQPRCHSSSPRRQWESKPVRCFPPTAGHAGLPASQQCARPVAEEEIKILSGVQEEFLPQLVPASPLPTFPRCGKPSRKLTHCLLLPRLGAGPCCLQHQRVAPFMDAGIAHCSDPPASACLGSPLTEPSTLLTSREQPWHPGSCAVCSWAERRVGSSLSC